MMPEIQESQCWKQRGLPPNKSLQMTFDPLPSFAFAKSGIASIAPELRR